MTSPPLAALITKWRQEAQTLEANAERAKSNIGVAGLSGYHAEYRRLAKLQNIMADELETAVLEVDAIKSDLLAFLSHVTLMDADVPSEARMIQAEADALYVRHFGRKKKK